MKTIPYQLPDDCVKFRVVELELLPEITQWTIANIEQGADLWTDFSSYSIWVIVPDGLLHSFLNQYGAVVSAC